MHADIAGEAVETKDSDSKRPEGPQIEAGTWFSLALAAAIISVCIFAATAIWIFTGELAAMPPRAQAFTPFGAALIAVVTFCTIAWRGVLNTKQLEYQAAQIAHQAEQLVQARRQNDAKDDENLAKLLMDGTKLLGEDRQSHIIAGVAALQAVVVSLKGSFSNQAMDILADLIEDTYNVPDKAKVFEAARDAINQGADAGRTSTRQLRLRFPRNRDMDVYAINGVKSIRYSGAQFSSEEYKKLKVARRTFYECSIEGVAIEGNIRTFQKCKFVDCEIRKLNARFVIDNEFEECDFSAAKYTGSGRFAKGSPPFDKLAGKGNFYRTEDPIDGPASIPWGNFLEQVTPVDPSEFFEDVEEEDEAGTTSGAKD